MRRKKGKNLVNFACISMASVAQKIFHKSKGEAN
jgi:hypothetical protein